jgi:hypothetical protein
MGQWLLWIGSGQCEETLGAIMATFDETSVVVEKLAAARHLLDRAIERLQAADYLSAIVLGGTAEDLFEGFLTQRGTKDAASRPQLGEAIPRVFNHLFPGDPAPTPQEAIAFMRETFNWLRHADRDEAQTRRLNLKSEAVALCTRAIDNLWELTGDEHPLSRALGYPVGN